MDTGGLFVAGSHNRNEFTVINIDESARSKPLKDLSGHICRICGDEIEITGDGFIACNECAFPVCRHCYEYERREGDQACPNCKTRYKRHKGSPRFDGDEEEDGVDDIENEFDFSVHSGRDAQHIAAAAFYGQLNGGLGPQSGAGRLHPGFLLDPEIPLMTYGEEDDEISSDSHALIIPPFKRCGKRIHSFPCLDSSMSIHPRPMDPKKDLAVYGYGSVAWKNRIEEWKKRHNDKLLMVNLQGGGVSDVDSLDDPDLPM
ncbi:hypothetical protein AAC387_Pa05g2929 [Persea americana]